MYNILVLHAYHYEYPLRATSLDWLYSFRRHSGHRCFYWNVHYEGVPWYLGKVRWDLILFTDLFVVERWNPDGFLKLVKKLSPLKHIDAVKALVPQDEFIYTDALCNLISAFDIRVVFTCAQESEWKQIYHTVDFEKVRFFTVLTGYVDEDTVHRITSLSQKVSKRVVDVGYRSKRVSPSLGSHGVLKVRLADVFQEEAPQKGLTTNISLRPQDTLLGDEWYRFLLQCKYLIGVEGGSSILDRDGTLRRKTDAYLVEHPYASYEEVESACFPDQDGSLDLFAISPRHLEACATRTCQVLIEGKYNGILVPGKHYIELRRDFGNLDDVFETIKRDDVRAEITERAYADIVRSGLYTYRTFVSLILEKTLGTSRNTSPYHSGPWERSAYVYSRLMEVLSWTRLACRTTLVKVARSIIPSGLIAATRRMRQVWKSGE